MQVIQEVSIHTRSTFYEHTHFGLHSEVTARWFLSSLCSSIALFVSLFAFGGLPQCSFVLFSFLFFLSFFKVVGLLY
jgi:hypothetical protein